MQRHAVARSAPMACSRTPKWRLRPARRRRLLKSAAPSSQRVVGGRQVGRAADQRRAAAAASALRTCARGVARGHGSSPAREAPADRSSQPSGSSPPQARSRARGALPGSRGAPARASRSTRRRAPRRASRAAAKCAQHLVGHEEVGLGRPAEVLLGEPRPPRRRAARRAPRRVSCLLGLPKPMCVRTAISDGRSAPPAPPRSRASIASRSLPSATRCTCQP